MTPTTLAQAIADCHATRARAQRQGTALTIVAAAAGCIAVFFAANSLVLAASGALVAALVAGLPAMFRAGAARRRLARLEADHPDIFPTAMERYRMVMATERASRYKVFC